MCLIGIITLVYIFAVSACPNDETMPPGLLSKDYDKSEPPWKKGMPAHLYIRLTVLDVDKINDGDMEFSVLCYLVELWNDTRLNFSSFLKASEIDPILPPHLEKHIWVPDLIFDNTKDGKVFDLSLPNRNIKVQKDGSLYRYTRYNFLVTCRMDFHLYPMDTQKCFIKIGSLVYPDFKLTLHWVEDLTPKDTESFLFYYNIEPLKYELRKPIAYKDTEVWPSGNFTFLCANFTFVRRLSGSFFNMYIPSSLIVLLSWISFWVDIEAVPARITLGVTSLLTLATQIVQARSGLPAISYMTAMDVWLFACLITVFSSLLEFAFAYQIFVARKQKAAKDSFVKNMDIKFITASDKILRSRFYKRPFLRRRLESRGEFSETKQSKTGCQKSLDKICRKMFPLGFCVFVTIYWSYYLT